MLHRVHQVHSQMAPRGVNGRVADAYKLSADASNPVKPWLLGLAEQGKPGLLDGSRGGLNAPDPA